MVTITLNGKRHEAGDLMTIAKLVESLAIPISGVAIAVNDEIIPRDRYVSHVIREGDRLEVIRAIGGG